MRMTIGRMIRRMIIHHRMMVSARRFKLNSRCSFAVVALDTLGTLLLVLSVAGLDLPRQPLITT
jgi:hypothetical protein